MTENVPLAEHFGPSATYPNIFLFAKSPWQMVFIKCPMLEGVKKIRGRGSHSGEEYSGAQLGVLSSRINKWHNSPCLFSSPSWYLAYSTSSELWKWPFALIQEWSIVHLLVEIWIVEQPFSYMSITEKVITKQLLLEYSFYILNINSLQNMKLLHTISISVCACSVGEAALKT